MLRSEEAGHFVQELPSPAERAEALVEPLVPKPQLLIVGGGHVGQAVAWQASVVGFEIVVLDDRPEFTRPELFPEGTTTLCGEVVDAVAKFSSGDDIFVVLVTRGHQHDAAALAACLRKPTAYLGMIGSRRKVVLVRKEFIESGRATAEEFDRVYAPIGLDIGAVTVPEIATSIVAQLITVRRKGAATRMPCS
ncbi:MAG: XdhC family protein [Verrucomicrobia bacterium]|nr:XdhC family protein [Verrucomicrobiota bacterium]